MEKPNKTKRIRKRKSRFSVSCSLFVLSPSLSFLQHTSISLSFSLSRSSSPLSQKTTLSNLIRGFKFKFLCSIESFDLKGFDFYVCGQRNDIKVSSPLKLKLIVGGTKDALDILLHVFQQDLHSSGCLLPHYSVNLILSGVVVRNSSLFFCLFYWLV